MSQIPSVDEIVFNSVTDMVRDGQLFSNKGRQTYLEEFVHPFEINGVVDQTENSISRLEASAEHVNVEAQVQQHDTSAAQANHVLPNDPYGSGVDQQSLIEVTKTQEGGNRDSQMVPNAKHDPHVGDRYQQFSPEAISHKHHVEGKVGEDEVAAKTTDVMQTMEQKRNIVQTVHDANNVETSEIFLEEQCLIQQPENDDMLTTQDANSAEPNEDQRLQSCNSHEDSEYLAYMLELQKYQY